MKEHFKGKVVWITGASSGIGEALALELARLGARLVLSARRLSELDRVKLATGLPDEAVFVQPLDLARAAEMPVLTRRVLDKMGHVDILINNGGISQRSLVLETPLEVDRRIMEVNFFGTVALTKSLLPHMVERGSGHLVATSSIVGKFGFPLRSAYSASKHALHGFFESLRAECQDQGIRVTLAIPGRIRTQISRHALTKDGQAHGQMDDGQDQGIPAEKAAQDLLRAIAREDKEVLTGGKELLMVHIRRFAPWLYYRMASKVKPT